MRRQLGMVPKFDCFADTPQGCCSRVARTREDVLKAFSDPRAMCWVNPPWKIWSEVEPYLSQGVCSAIVICPAWQKPWVKNLLSSASQRIYVEKGTRLFECPSISSQGILWGVWALRINQGPRPQNVGLPSVFPCHVFKWSTHSQTLPKLSKKMVLSCRGRQFVPAEFQAVSASEKPQMLDLFSGTGSVSKYFENKGMK